MDDIIDSNANDRISWITSSAQGWWMSLGELCLDCSSANKAGSMKKGKWKFWLWLNLELLSSHDEVKTDPRKCSKQWKIFQDIKKIGKSENAVNCLTEHKGFGKKWWIDLQ